MTNNTESPVHFVAKLDHDSIPKEAWDRAKRQILDIIGVALVSWNKFV
jgi:hypothetical protein